MGYGIKIFDAYRPWSVQKKMWAVYPHAGYVADPKKGSKHNRGAAVDLTLVNLTTGQELLMPTGFDNFTEKRIGIIKADRPKRSRNRNLLEQVMVKHGFRRVDF